MTLSPGLILTSSRARVDPLQPRPRPQAATGTVAVLLGLAAATVGLKPEGWPASVPVYAVFAGLAVAVALAAQLDRPRRVRVTAIDAAFVAYIFTRLAVELIDNSALGQTQLVPVADLVVSYLATWAVRLAVGAAEITVFLRAFVLVSVPVSLIAVVQIIDWPGVNDFLAANTRGDALADRLDVGRSIRATSTLGHWTSLGGYLAGVVAVCCFLLIRSRGRRGALVVATLLLALVAQLATLTSAPVLVSLVVLGYTFTRLPPKLRIAGLVGAVAAAGVALTLFGNLATDRVDEQLSGRAAGIDGWLPLTIAFRLQVWVQETIPSILQRPWQGWGNAVYDGSGIDQPPMLAWKSPESEWFRVAMEAGVVALLVLVVLLVHVVRAYRIVARHEPGAQALRVYVLGLLVISCIHSHFSNRGVPMVFWVVTAVVMVLAAERTREGLSSCPA